MPAGAGGYPGMSGFPGVNGAQRPSPPTAPWFDPFRYVERGHAPLGQRIGEAFHNFIGDAMGGVSIGRERQVEERYWKQGPKVPLSTAPRERQRQLAEAETLRRGVEPYWQRQLTAYYEQIGRITAKPKYQGLLGLRHQVGLLRDDALRFKGLPGGIEAGRRADALEAEALRREFQQYQEVRRATEQFRATLTPERLRQEAFGGKLTPFQARALQAISSVKQDYAVHQRQIGSGLVADLAITSASILTGRLLGSAGSGTLRILAEGEGPLARAAQWMISKGKAIQGARIFQGPVGEAFRPDRAAANSALIGMLQQPTAYLSIEKNPKVDRLMEEALTGFAGGYLAHGTTKLAGGLLERLVRGGYKLTETGFRYLRGRVSAARARTPIEAAQAMEQGLAELQQQNPAALVMMPNAETGGSQKPAGRPPKLAVPVNPKRPVAPGKPGGLQGGVPRNPGHPGAELLHQAVTSPEAHRQFTIDLNRKKPAQVRWYEVGQARESRAAREQMAAYLEAQYPKWAKKKWTVPGKPSGTLRELLVEHGVVPAEVGDRYAPEALLPIPRGRRVRGVAREAFPVHQYSAQPGIRKGGAGVVKPGGVPAPWSRVHWLEVAEAPQFEGVNRNYNGITRPIHNTLYLPWGTVKEAKEVQAVIRALQDKNVDVRFHVVASNRQAGIWKMIDPETGRTYYHLQANPFDDPTGAVRRHELLHLAAMLNGQEGHGLRQFYRDYPHELAVSWSTTPKNAAPKAVIYGLATGGGLATIGALGQWAGSQFNSWQSEQQSRAMDEEWKRKQQQAIKGSRRPGSGSPLPARPR
jgi:hypothetical protein